MRRVLWCGVLQKVLRVHLPVQCSVLKVLRVPHQVQLQGRAAGCWCVKNKGERRVHGRWG